MTLIHHDAVIVVGGWNGRFIRGIENALDHSLHSSNVDFRIGVCLCILQFLQLENVCKGLEVLHTRFFERISCLFS